jgi:hypothetical protein
MRNLGPASCSLSAASRLAGLIVISALALLGQPATVRAAGPPNSDRENLLDYAGSYDSAALLAKPRIQNELQRIAGDELDHLQRNLNVSGRIDLIDGWLGIAGNAPHAGTEEEAVICINPVSNSVHAAILSGEAITILTDAAAYTDLPLCIKDWITLANSRHRDRLIQPANASLGLPLRRPVDGPVTVR